MNKYRTHNCSELSEKEIDSKVMISGWLHRKRDHGNLLFIDLRDHYGMTQCVIENNNSFFPILENSLAKRIDEGVLPVPPTYMLPIQIIGMLNFDSLVNFFFKKIINPYNNVKGNNKIGKKFLSLSQNLGLYSLIRQ